MNMYAYAGNNPVNRLDPQGTAWRNVSNSLGSISNFSAGFGDFITFGATDWLRQQWGYNNVVDKSFGFYTAGQVAGFGASLMLGVASSLNAGGQTLLYSGQGAETAALNAAKAGFGKTILNTSGGKALRMIEGSTGRKLPVGIWKVASNIFVRNAKGEVTAFVNNPWSGSVYTTVEKVFLKGRINELLPLLW